MTLTVDVISDVICPWCFIGKRRLEKAIQFLNGQHEVRVRWHPFQLNPHMSKEGISRMDYRTAKFGSWEKSLALDAQMTEAGASEGIAFALDRIERTPNTVDAHRLIWLAGNQGVQEAVVEALFRAYFCEGRNIGDRDTLLDVVAAAGLSWGRAQELLDGGEGLDAIRAAEERPPTGRARRAVLHHQRRHGTVRGTAAGGVPRRVRAADRGGDTRRRRCLRSPAGTKAGVLSAAQTERTKVTRPLTASRSGRSSPGAAAYFNNRNESRNPRTSASVSVFGLTTHSEIARVPSLERYVR